MSQKPGSDAGAAKTYALFCSALANPAEASDAHKRMCEKSADAEHDLGFDRRGRGWFTHSAAAELHRGFKIAAGALDVNL
jgi:hypothetical protein